MKNSLSLLAALPLVSAFPAVLEAVQKRAIVYPEIGAPQFTTDRDNCGSHGKCTVFNADDQLVDVSQGSGHEFQSPGANDLRGQCPGLNAAANHAFLPRNGIATIQQTVDGLGAAYSMSPELGAALAVIAIAISGDPVAGTWSIGGGYNGALSLLGRPTGIAGTHSRYEGDASIVRGDAFMNNNNVGVFEMHRWNRLYSLLGEEDNLTHDKAANQAAYTSQYSLQNNGYYFSAPFSGLVAPDAHNFVVHFMSNRSEENKGGQLTGETLKSFFAVTGEPGSFVHNRGQERIPDNWYKRPTSQPMNTVDTNVDTVINDRMYPGIIRFGGNTGTPNSFVGVDLGDLTSGAFNAGSLGEGNNAACFFLRAAQAGLADPISPLTGALQQGLDLVTNTLGPQASALGCPQLDTFNNDAFKQFKTGTTM